MAELKNNMFNYKNKIDMGKFSEFTYEQLKNLVNPYEFYFNIDNEQELLNYMQALHIAYCKKNNEQYAPVKYRKQEGTTMGFTVFEKNPEVHINSYLGYLLEIMKACHNKYFPFYIYEVIIHESHHIFQINAINSGNFEKLNPESRLGAYYQQLMDAINKQYNADRFNRNTDKNIVLSNFFDIDDLVFDIRRSNNGTYFYGNEPCEIAARDYTCEECKHLLKIPKLPLDVKRLFKAYLTEQARDSVYLAYDEKTSNFNFFWNMLKSDLLNGYPNVVQAKQQLVSEIDSQFKAMGLRTINQTETELYDGAEHITKRLLARAKLINSKIENGEGDNPELQAEAEKLAESYDRMIDKLFLKRIEDYKQLEHQYFELFPILKSQKQTVMGLRERGELLGDKNAVEGIIFDDNLKLKKVKK